MAGVLSGLKIVEFEGLGPGPFCGMTLADLGAEVTLISRAGGPGGKAAIFNRGKKSIVLDLKKQTHIGAAIKIAAGADAIIEGLRPGVMERLGLGPDVLQGANPRLVYGRLTGWGQTGPLSSVAGHDVNYVSTAGAAWYASQAGSPPTVPPTMVGDIGGGALYLAIGILAGVMRARQTGQGAVVDAAIVDGAAHMSNLLLSLRAAGGLPEARGNSMLDGAHFYRVYQCADGRHISLGPLEPKFYALLIDKLGLSDDPLFSAQFDQSQWPDACARFAEIFAAEPMSYWCDLLEGTDVCFGPVLEPGEAADHPHMAARKIYRNLDGVLQAAAAPRFDGETPHDPTPAVQAGAHTDEILESVGLSRNDLAD